MTIKLGMVAVVWFVILSSCQNKPKVETVDDQNIVPTESNLETQITDIPYIVAKNYFVKNTVQKLDHPKIETAEQFNEIFGMATTMGKDGKPTEIDFEKQNSIALILPETDIATTIEVVSLQKNGHGKITFRYKRTVGQKQSFTIRPNVVVLIDKSENGDIAFLEQP